MRSLELKIPPVVIGLVLAGLMWAAARFGTFFGFTLPLPAGPMVASGFIETGIVIAVLGVISFRRAKTTVNPLVPAATSSLVVKGIYRWTRNPMYLGMLLVLLGWGVLLANALAFVFPVVFVLLMNRLQIVPEERALTARFGAEFAAYQSKVRRWL